MKSNLDCIPCFFEQAIRTGRIVARDEALTKKIVDQLGLMLPSISLENSPPETGRLIYDMINRLSGNPDPYQKLKEESTKLALSLYPSLKNIINKSDDPLLTAIRIAIAGNIIDYGANASFDIENTIEEVLCKEFALFDYELFYERLDKTEQVLYIGDNAGETVFDRLLIEQLAKPVIYAVRDKPIINDATFDDAHQAGLDNVCEIVSSGCDAPGTLIKRCSSSFLSLLEKSTFTISKGQGNFEGLANEKYNIFFLLKVKCKLIADHIGVSNGDIVLKGVNL